MEVFYLTKDDFESIMGNFQDALEGNTVSRAMKKAERTKRMSAGRQRC